MMDYKKTASELHNARLDLRKPLPSGRKREDRPPFGRFRSWMDLWYDKNSDHAQRTIADGMRCYRSVRFLGFGFLFRTKPTRQDVYIHSEFLKMRSKSKKP